MRYSILLPTRNGAALLENVLHSVLGQDYADMELVVSNNASEDGTREILARLASDPRLRVVHLEAPVGVTENWNVALAHSRGERVVLLGDDDLLLPRYFERLDELLARHDEPECLTYNGYAYAFPGFSGSPHSHYADPFYVNDPRVSRDGPLAASLRREIVGEMFRFRFPLALNMQVAAVSRRAIDRLADGLFKEPFPDFYGLGALLLTARTWAHVDERLVVVGVSPKSFGRTVHSAVEQARGLEYLGIDTDFPGQLPGSEIVNGTYRCLLELERDYPDALRGIEIDRPEYVLQQAYAWYIQARLRSLPPRAIGRRLRRLRAGDWWPLARMLARRLTPGRLRRRLRINPSDPAAQLWAGMRPLPEVHDIAQFGAWITAGELAGLPAHPR